RRIAFHPTTTALNSSRRRIGTPATPATTATHAAVVPPAPKSCTTGSNWASSTSTSCCRGGSTLGGGGGGGGGLGMATSWVVAPWLSGSGVRERSGVTSTGTHPRSPASS